MTRIVQPIIMCNTAPAAISSCHLPFFSFNFNVNFTCTPAIFVRPFTFVLARGTVASKKRNKDKVARQKQMARG